MNTPENPELKEKPETAEQAQAPEQAQAAEPPPPETEHPEAKKKAGMYDSFAEMSREIFNASQEKGRDAWEKAMERARERMTAAGEFSAEQGELFKRYLRRDLDQTRDEMRELGEEAKVRLNPARVGAGALSSLSKLMSAAGHLLSELSQKTETALEYEAGEITMAGTLTCQSCGHKIHLTQTSVVPKCPKCEGTKFRKGY